MSAAPLPPPSVLVDDVVEEVLLRLPPEEPAWLVRSSAVCKSWRRILASQSFRRRYRDFHRTPPLLGFFEEDGRFVPTSSLFPAQPDPAGWITLDCRHGRALFIPCTWDLEETYQLLVSDPVTGHRRRVTSPVAIDYTLRFRAVVLCAGHGCNGHHHSCQENHFRVAFLTVDEEDGLASAWLYSSDTGLWSKLTYLHLPTVNYTRDMGSTTILVHDALYFNIHVIIKYELGTRHLSMFDVPVGIDYNGSLMTTEDGGLGFAAVVDSNLMLWSMDTGPDGALGWAKQRIIDLKTLIPDVFSIPRPFYMSSSSLRAWVSGFAEGTHIIFVGSYNGFYMVDLKSGLVRMVTMPGTPYVNFYIPEMEAASTG